MEGLNVTGILGGIGLIVMIIILVQMISLIMEKVTAIQNHYLWL